MSNPNWPEGSSPFPGSSQQPIDPSAQQPFIPQPAQPEGYPYSQPAAPSQPLYPYGQPAAQTFDPNPAPTEQTLQPAAPSQPLYPYGQPAAPSQPLYPYGQPAAPSQPLYPYGQYGQPSQTLPGQPGQFGPPSQALPGGMPGGQSRGMPRGLIIGSIVALVILLLAGSGTAFAVTQVQPAAANAAVKFCTALKAQDYIVAYSELSAKLKEQYTQTQFTQDMGTLDKADGAVSTCQQSSANSAYAYSLGSSTATDLILIARGSNSLQGLVHLTNAGNLFSANWQVSAIDTSLLGVNLKALEATTAFCTALQNKDYSTAFASFGTPPTSLKSATVFKSNGALWDQIDGSVTACTVSGVGSSNDDASANLSISVTRAKSGAHSSAISLSASGDTWKISNIDATVIGTDLGPLATGTQFCDDLVANKLSAAYDLLSDSFKQDLSRSSFVTALTLPDGAVWKSYKLKLDSYKVTGSTATFNLDLKVVIASIGQSLTFPTTLSFVKQGDSWALDDLRFGNPS